MKVTVKEQEILKHLLWNNVKYQETYNELYDHVLTAAEELAEKGTWKYAGFDPIITLHFGGLANLNVLEDERSEIVKKQISKKLREYLLSYFKPQLLLFTLILAIIIYYVADTISRKAIYYVVPVISISPVLLVRWRDVFNLFKRKSYKPSIKYEIIKHMASLSVSIFSLSIFLPPLFTNVANYKFFLQANSVIVAVAATVMIINSITFFRLYHNEFKMQIV